MREHVLAMLKESDDFVSGQELCGKLSVSRTAIWKAINSLKEAGYVIEAVRNRPKSDKSYEWITPLNPQTAWSLYPK